MSAHIWRSSLLIGLLLLGRGGAYAEGSCPLGMYPNNPGSTSGVNGCNPIPGYGNQRPSPPPAQEWERRWGAVATGTTKAILGTATDMRSKGEAVQAALADCEAKGGSPCKLQISYDNQCAVMVVGNKGFNVNNAATSNQARQDAMKVCGADGDTGCHVYYSACSMPARIR